MLSTRIYFIGVMALGIGVHGCTRGTENPPAAVSSSDSQPVPSPATPEKSEEAVAVAVNPPSAEPAPSAAPSAASPKVAPAAPAEAPATKPAEASPTKPAEAQPAKKNVPSTVNPPVTAPSTARAIPKVNAPAASAATSKTPTSTAPPSAAKTTTPATAPNSPIPLDLVALEKQLKATKAIGVFSKIALKNQVDDLMKKFREHYQGKGKATMADLRQAYDLLMMKVLTMVQDDDKNLAAAIVSSRAAIWELLADPVKFAALDA